MYYVSEQAVRQAVAQHQVTSAVEQVFVSQAESCARNFPVVREQLGYADAIFGFKSGFDQRAMNLGVKAGGLWPGNRSKGMANHQSTIVLFDADTGAPAALVRGTYLTALRTAAASALSIRALALANSDVLGVIGTGGQAEWQIRAAVAERPFGKVLLGRRNDAQCKQLIAALRDLALPIEVVDFESLVRRSQVVISVTPARSPVIQADWVQPGTHIACMGADTLGKQELEVSLCGAARVFADQPEQAVQLGELQHASAAGLIEGATIPMLGQVLAGLHPGRTNPSQITLFDSTGMGLQDLAAARLALDLALQAGLAAELP
ncbi:MAG: ornithine cyclodeaminase family protein [Pseudomonadota bacterium]